MDMDLYRQGASVSANIYSYTLPHSELLGLLKER